jgi:hypothetical protein
MPPKTARVSDDWGDVVEDRACTDEEYVLGGGADGGVESV